MSKTRIGFVALVCLAAAASAHGARQERWRVETASGKLAFYPEVLRAIGAQVTPKVRPDADARLPISFDGTGSLELDAPGSLFRDVLTGSLRLDARGALRGRQGEIALHGMELRRGAEERTLEFVDAQGRVWFEADHMHFDADRKQGRFRMFNLDVRLTAEAARVLGDVSWAELAVAVLELDMPVPALAGAEEQPDGACVNPDWGNPHNDVGLHNISSVQQMARDANAPVRIALSPSAVLKNVGQTDVPWHTKFTGNFPPYNNDQHPYLIWNLYRLSGGTLEQLAASPLKHAFLTVNSACGCPSGHILWVGCEDTYGTSTNDSVGSLGPRSEVLANTGYWQRCQSIFDTNCDGVGEGGQPRANLMDRRMAVLESDLQAGGTFYFDSWYVVRDDVNIYNTMGWRILSPVAPTPPSTQWTFALTTPLNLGPVIDQWVSPSAPGANEQNVEIANSFGHLKLAVKASNLGGGQWRYEYALANFDFDPAIKSFRVPLPTGATPSNIGFHDPDQNAATDWAGTFEGGDVVWRAPNDTSIQRWGTLYNFRFTTNASPSAADGVTTTLGVHAARGWEIKRSVLGPATASLIDAHEK